MYFIRIFKTMHPLPPPHPHHDGDLKHNVDSEPHNCSRCLDTTWQPRRPHRNDVASIVRNGSLKSANPQPNTRRRVNNGKGPNRKSKAPAKELRARCPYTCAVHHAHHVLQCHSKQVKSHHGPRLSLSARFSEVHVGQCGPCGLWPLLH